MDHLAAIIRGKQVDGAVVAAAATGVLRLCQRLLPYKPDAAEPLLRGLQLVPGLAPEVAWDNAEAIAAEMLALVQAASPHIKAQWAWASALSWVVREALTPLNYVLAVEAAVWFVERAAAEHPAMKPEVLELLLVLAAWLEGWSASLAGAGLSPEQESTFTTAKSEFWLYLVETLSRLADHADKEVRSAATSALQRAALGAEALGVLPDAIERGLVERVLPQLEALGKKAAKAGSRGAMKERQDRPGNWGFGVGLG
ncbi:hypothetical protein MNEG_15254 [Monoraphidium neglectum]|uniref:Uncharacterized protein n=1 Tax=Monoraphidium neglectum TaxID=145388 RepID=A0A0D2LLQ5_9CHLO|nr:hypothetical protein MNEG_15254 [Monoraphidium neglectum]KIY92709.1 hypothetical protein MNEG_15254 [Monoraphidium neglectum]|eukprot:XP_013891729.1 hypothetical protein MNEG_15254 [Monoraphidium neglectum]